MNPISGGYRYEISADGAGNIGHATTKECAFESAKLAAFMRRVDIHVFDIMARKGSFGEWTFHPDGSVSKHRREE